MFLAPDLMLVIRGAACFDFHLTGIAPPQRLGDRPAKVIGFVRGRLKRRPRPASEAIAWTIDGHTLLVYYWEFDI